MIESKSKAKLTKPYKDFPLTPHPNGTWCKRIKGRLYYFGKDTKAALEKYNRDRDDLYAGRTPRPKTDGLTLLDLANRFLTAKRQQADSGELSPRVFASYFRLCERLLALMGKTKLVSEVRSEDFQALKTEFMSRLKTPSSLSTTITNVRVIFRFAYTEDLISKPVNFGQVFKKPGNRAMRVHRQSQGERLFEAEEVRRMLNAAQPIYRAMILLGCNCGFGNADCGTLPISAIDFEAGWVNHPRPKTAISRRVPLWPETLSSLRLAISKRPKPKKKEHGGLVFLTYRGASFYRNYGCDDLPDGDLDSAVKAKRISSLTSSPLSQTFKYLLDELALYRPGLGFYTFRRILETIGGNCQDQVAVDAVMGHVDNSMASHYRERIDEARLRRVVNTVRDWLFPPGMAVVSLRDITITRDDEKAANGRPVPKVTFTVALSKPVDQDVTVTATSKIERIPGRPTKYIRTLLETPVTIPAGKSSVTVTAALAGHAEDVRGFGLRLVAPTIGGVADLGRVNLDTVALTEPEREDSRLRVVAAEPAVA